MMGESYCRCGLCIADLNTSRPDKIELVTFVNDNDSELVKQLFIIIHTIKIL